jgi:mRNA-degrading endonuclease toxin of MazEF toxin-antitoxin module
MYRRGAVWMAELPDIGRKPAVVVSARLVTLKLSPIVARITSVARERMLATVVALAAGEIDGLGEASFVLGHDLFILPEGGLITHLGWLQSDRMLEVDDAMLTALGIDLP